MGKMVGPHLLEALPLRSRASRRCLAGLLLQFPYQLDQCNDDTGQIGATSCQIVNLLFERFSFQIGFTAFIDPIPVDDILAACGDDHAPPPSL